MINIELTEEEAESLRDLLTAIRLNWKIKQTPENNARVIALHRKLMAATGKIPV